MSVSPADGRWPELLAALAGLSFSQLSPKHGPCPLCGGTDRYRFDDLNGTGSWFCNQCGGKDQRGGGGSGMDLLMRVKGWSYPEAARATDDFLGIARTPQASLRSAPPVSRADSYWQYSDTYYVCRFPGKKFRPLSWDGINWIWKAPPAPRPLLYLKRLKARPNAVVLVVEGEKTADAAQRLFPAYVVTTWPNGSKAISKADWKPLANRDVVLWPDNDDAGNAAMAAIALILQALPAASIKLVANPPDAPTAWDIADASWSLEEAVIYIEANTSEVLAPTSSQPPPPGTPPSAASVQPPPPPPPFELLGFSHGTYYYQPHSTAQVTPLLRSAHTGTNLTALAPLAYWQQVYASRRSVDWAAAASDLFEKQARIGMYSPERLRGRGAWWDKNRSIIHLGNRILVDNKKHALHGFGSNYHYQRGEALHGFDGIKPLTAEEGLAILNVATMFLWEQEPSAQLLAGWIALAPISGALKWRPHVWLTAPAGAGKSTILDRFVGPLLADFAQVFVGNSTEAGIRQQLRSDALPVVLDEAESNEKSDQARIQSILSLARVSSSESSASIIKGSSSGETARFRARSMFMFSSISTSLKQGADRRRFAQLTLQTAAAKALADAQGQWEELDKSLDRLITPEIGRRLIARTVSMIPIIRQTIALFTAVAARKFDSQALGDQYGTLMAGAWSLQSDSVPTDAVAHELIGLIDWSEYQQATEIPDERRCLDTILQQPIRVETDERAITRTLLELIQMVQTPSAKPFELITTEIAAAHLGRHGLQVKDGLLLVANNSKALTKLLAETAWQHSYPTVLRRLNGATAAGSHYFRGVGQHRAIAVPLQTL